MDFKTIHKIGAVLAFLGIWLVASTTASASMVIYTGTTPLKVDESNPTTAGVVGTIGGTTGQGQGGWTSSGLFQQGAATALLNLGLSGSGSYLGEPIKANSLYDYSGTVIASPYESHSKDDTGFSRTVPVGWEFAIAKYDGKNAGYVLYYLGGQSATLPFSPANFWTGDSSQYGISGWTAFNAVPEPTTMIAGALLLLPFGLSTLRALRNRRVQA